MSCISPKLTEDDFIFIPEIKTDNIDNILEKLKENPDVQFVSDERVYTFDSLCIDKNNVDIINIITKKFNNLTAEEFECLNYTNTGNELSENDTIELLKELMSKTSIDDFVFCWYELVMSDFYTDFDNNKFKRTELDDQIIDFTRTIEVELRKYDPENPPIYDVSYDGQFIYYNSKWVKDHKTLLHEIAHYLVCLNADDSETFYQTDKGLVKRINYYNYGLGGVGSGNDRQCMILIEDLVDEEVFASFLGILLNIHFFLDGVKLDPVYDIVEHGWNDNRIYKIVKRLVDINLISFTNEGLTFNFM